MVSFLVKKGGVAGDVRPGDPAFTPAQVNQLCRADHYLFRFSPASTFSA
jgi:hypothetical protein